ncbi:hypothetical protein Fcan01_27640 [Folsomia candida]|uniref:Gustatory receptor n=1 Tax=Folsomia candida TaxID=158441 RepID=A0A226CX85_FOLCA|nr:hypothetical protein Fcan01_27640 [Folsomia candida]
MLSTYIELLQTLQNLYFDHFPLMYKLPFEIRRTKGNGIRLSKVKRRNDRVVSLFPAFIFASAVFLFIVATRLRTPLVARPMGDAKMWGWFVLGIACFSGLVFYTLWMLVYQSDAIFMCNEIFRWEEELRKDSSQTKHIPVKATLLEKTVLLGFKLLVWMYYFVTPIDAAVTTFLTVDPLLPFFEFVLNMIPQLRKLLLFFAFNSEALFYFAMFLVRVGCVTVFLYEGFRLAAFCIGLTILIGKVVVSYLSSVSRLTDTFQENIIQHGLWSHLKIYKVLPIIFQSLEAPMKSTASLAIVAGTVAVSGCTFVVIKLHAVNDVYMTGFCLGVSVSAVILTKIILDTLANLDETSVKVLLQFRRLEILQKMGEPERKIYLKELYYLKPIAIPVGLGTARFSRITNNVKTTILMFMLENSINLLLAF